MLFNSYIGDMMLHDKLWVYNEISDGSALKLSKDSGISFLMAKVFLSRGIDDIGYINEFLNPSLENLLDPFLMKDMEKAVNRIIKAVNGGERITVYGDYDVDGITSTSILMNFLKSLGADVDFFIPDRINEGYGLSVEAIDKLLKESPSLIITVDCGITSIEEVEYINKNNIDIIITDHHKCMEEIPGAYAVVNPKRSDCSYPFKELAGVGVAYKLVHALCISMKTGDLHREYLDLVAVGTVADVVSLTGENRIIVKYGLERIKQSANLGVLTLLECCGLMEKPINSWTISFILAPRINAAGRIGDAGKAVTLFGTESRKEATDIITGLNDQNRFRQETELVILNEVIQKIDEQVDLEKDRVIIVSGEEWHHGIIGIVASKVTERYYRPCILLSHENGVCKGSGRSVESFNLFKALNHCSGLLENFGGHELAAGLSLRYENLDKFKEMMNSYARLVLSEQDLIPRIKIDTKIDIKELNIKDIRELEKLAPFGAGNPGPVFCIDGLRIDDIRTVGENKHLKLRLGEGNLYTDAIGFGMGSLINCYGATDMVDAAFTPEINTWNSIDRIQMNLRDLRFSEEIVMEKQYYYSLDKCRWYYGSNDGIAQNPYKTDINYRINGSVDEELINTIKNNERVVIFVNTLESVRELKRLFKKYIVDINKQLAICYTCINETEGGKAGIFVVVNPVIDGINLENFGRVVFYGAWIDRAYLNILIDKVKDKCVLLLEENPHSKLEDIIPERADLVAVYQFLKAKAEPEIIIEDLFMLAGRIGLSYRLNMNYFKLKKCIEILEELKLLEKEQLGLYGMIIRLCSDVKGKTRLEESSLYRRLQLIKPGKL